MDQREGGGGREGEKKNRRNERKRRLKIAVDVVDVSTQSSVTKDIDLIVQLIYFTKYLPLNETSMSKDLQRIEIALRLAMRLSLFLGAI